MAFGQGQIVHVGVEVMVALRAVVCRIRENDIAWSAGKGVSQIMQGAGNGSKPVCTMFAQRTRPSFIVAAAPYKFWSRQILNTYNPLRFICYIFARSKHLDNLQHRFIFPCWNIGTKSLNTSNILCIVTTVSPFLMNPTAGSSDSSPLSI